MPAIYEAIRLAAQKLSLAGVPDADAYIEARLLYQHAARISAERLISRLQESADTQTLEVFTDLVDQRRSRKPLAYIVGEKEFYGRTFRIDARSLIPRPETEMIVELGLRFVQQQMIVSPRICDIGTGSGALAITLAIEIPGSKVVATDIAADALELAIYNARSLGINPSQISFIRDDISNRSLPTLTSRFDLIVSNPPYITTSKLATLEPEVRSWEPVVALDGGENGMKVLDPLIAALPHLLMTDKPSAALIEIDPPISERCEAAARKAFPQANISILKDLAALDRVLSITSEEVANRP